VSTVAIFPGQGAQAVGMGRALSERFEAARRAFEEADEVLGYPLSEICFEGPAERLTATDVCQPALVATSVAAWRVAREAGLRPALVMGHSLGEYSALVACGSLSFDEALRLVRARGDATTDVSAATPGQMVAILGASDEDVEAMCLEAGEVWPANYNGPGQIVASGLQRGVDRLRELAYARGLKAKLLDVDGAFHSSVMAPAAERLREALASVKIGTPSLPFLSATSGRFERGERLRTLLAQQLTAPVRFTQTVRMALDHGVDGFVEFGHRRVLVGLVRRIRPDVQAIHLGDPSDLPALLAMAGRAA
jgi:[acyl-carrier-protein] S-malonyltransferase